MLRDAKPAREGVQAQASLLSANRNDSGNPSESLITNKNIATAACELAQLGYHVHQLCPDQKRPATRNGHFDATNDPLVVTRLWQCNPRGNIGISLPASGLFVIGPDSLGWLEEFERRGLPDTLVSETASGPGHRHYFYRRPPNAPIHRFCVSDQFDLIANGYAIAPPSATSAPPAKVTGEYKWLTALRRASELPEAPMWAVEMIQQHADVEAARPPATLPSLQPLRASDQEIMDMIRRSKNGPKFERLFAGDIQAHDGINRSHSGADLALLGMLTFWIQDEEQLDRIFAQSGLYRPEKWRGSYRTATIAKALARHDYYRSRQRTLRRAASPQLRTREVNYA